MSEQRQDIYTRITNDIIAAIERGAEHWKMPWHHDGSATFRPINLASQKPYRGVNVVALWAAAEVSGFQQGLWGTYRQWQAQGAQVRKGERGSTVVLWKQSGAADSNADDGREPSASHRRFFAQGYTVFNLAQVDGYMLPETPRLDSCARHQNADQFIRPLS